MSKVIYEDCKTRRKNLSVAWIDCRKAFDSVPHRWIEKSTVLGRVNSKIVRFCKSSMEMETGGMESKPIKIQRGAFQGDSLSPLLLCKALIPLTNELNRADCGYQTPAAERKTSHLLCMD